MSEDTLQWNEEATTRLEKIPAGFMRNMTKMRIEEHSVANNIAAITLEVVEEVIVSSRAGMGSMMGGDASPSGMMEGMGHPAHIEWDNVSAKEEEETEIYLMCFVCGFTVQGEVPEQCSICGSEKEKYSVIEKQHVTSSCMKPLEWSESAKGLLKKVPDDFRQDMTKWEIEGFCRKKGYCVVTADAVEERYKVWDNIAKQIDQRLQWCEEVSQKIERIPSFIRGMIVKEMELFADRKGETVVSIETLNGIKDKWVNQQEFHVKWQK